MVDLRTLLVHRRALTDFVFEYGGCKTHALIQSVYDSTEDPEVELLCEELMHSLKLVATEGWYFGHSLDFKLR